jgi:flagellar protein FliO/FliZ
MMLDYLLRLLFLLPLVGGLAWGSLWLWRRVQIGLPAGGQDDRPARLIGVLPMGPQTRLAVIDFRGRELLVAVGRGQVTLLAEQPLGDFHD